MMKMLVVALLLALTAVVALAAGVKSIHSVDARKLLNEKRNVFLLDVRTPEEFRQAHLKGAALIPMGEFERRAGEVPRNRPVIVYCAVGSRSAAVAGFLAGKGYGEVYNMTDGIVGWYRNGLPIER